MDQRRIKYAAGDIESVTVVHVSGRRWSPQLGWHDGSSQEPLFGEDENPRDTGVPIGRFECVIQLRALGSARPFDGELKDAHDLGHSFNLATDLGPLVVHLQQTIREHHTAVGARSRHFVLGLVIEVQKVLHLARVEGVEGARILEVRIGGGLA